MFCPVLRTQRRVLAAAVVRLAFLPLFFVYVFAEGVLPRNDIAAMAAIGVWSFTSGFINTVAYQLAPLNVGFENGTKVANLVNTVFHAAVYCGLAVSCSVRLGIDASGGAASS